MKHHNAIRITFTAIILMMVMTQCMPPNPGDNYIIPVNEVKASRYIIPIDAARNMIDSFKGGRKELQAKLPAGYLDSTFNLPDAETFNRDAMAVLLNAKDARGVRIYLGQDGKGQVRFVLLPVDSSGNDIVTPLISEPKAINVPGVLSAYAQSGGQAVESGQRCPPLCKVNPDDDQP